MHNLKRMFGQRVLPIVYDDSLSYYEMICKMMRTINEIIENNNLLEQYVGSYMPTFNGDWDVTKTYQPLSVVLYDDQLYISKQEVPVGIAITAGDYWEEINLPYFDSIANLNSLDVLTPDQFSGTDTEKLTQAVTACADGGTICINREYVLDSNWVIDHLSSRQEHYIHILGLGKNAVINLNGYNIVGDRAAGEGYGSNSVGGVFWDNIEFTGEPTQAGFITDRLIRMFFTGCHFYGMLKAFYGNDSFDFNSSSREGVAQSYYFSQCYFGCLKENAFDAYRVFDCHFNNCIFEYDHSSIKVRRKVEGLFVTNCLMENINGTAIDITVANFANGGGCFTAVINNNYFEDNRISIDLSGVKFASSVVISNNMHCPGTNNDYFIHMPRNLKDKYPQGSADLSPILRITGNCLYPSAHNDGSHALLFDLFDPVTGEPWAYNLTGLHFEDNNFELTNSNASMKQLYTLNYRPINKAYTKDNNIGFVALFNSEGTQTTSAPANKAIDTSGSDYTIVSIRDTISGNNICNETGYSTDPNDWYYIDASATAMTVRAKRESGSFNIPASVLRSHAGDVIASVVVAWKYDRSTAPGKS